jgi:hypothetical protein
VLRGASAFVRAEAKVHLAAQALFRDARRGNASERGHQGRPHWAALPGLRQELRSARRCQARQADSNHQGLREPPDASAAGRHQQVEHPARRAEQWAASRVWAQRTVVEQAMTSPAGRPLALAAHAAPVARWERPERRPDEQALAREQLLSQRQEEALLQESQRAGLASESWVSPLAGSRLLLEKRAVSLPSEVAGQQPAPRAGGEQLWRLPLWQLSQLGP